MKLRRELTRDDSNRISKTRFRDLNLVEQAYNPSLRKLLFPQSRSKSKNRNPNKQASKQQKESDPLKTELRDEGVPGIPRELDSIPSKKRGRILRIE